MARLIHLNSPDSAIMSCYASLRYRAKSVAADTTFIVEGRLCVHGLLRGSLEVQSILVQQGLESELLHLVEDTVPVYVLPKKEISQLVGYDFHRGFLASAIRPNLLRVDELQWSKSVCAVAIAALGVTECENLGSIFRTAAALGVADILLDHQSADPYARRTVRVSMANVFKQQIYLLDDALVELRRLALEKNVRIVVTTLSEQSIPITSWQPDDRPVILILGSEASGVDPRLEAIATDCVKIPMELGTDSLNVSVAAGICLHAILHASGRGNSA